MRDDTRDDDDDRDRPRRRSRDDNRYEDDDDRRRPRRRREEDYEDDYDDDDEDDRPRRRGREQYDPAMRMLAPVNTSALAIAAGYAGLISVLCFPAPIALILGILALIQLRKRPELDGKGRAIFAIVMGLIFTLLMVGFVIVAVVGGIKNGNR